MKSDDDIFVSCQLMRKNLLLCRYVNLRLVDLKVDLTGRVGLHQPFVWTRKVDLKVDQTEINIPTLGRISKSVSGQALRSDKQPIFMSGPSSILTYLFLHIHETTWFNDLAILDTILWTPFGAWKYVYTIIQLSWKSMDLKSKKNDQFYSIVNCLWQFDYGTSCNANSNGSNNFCYKMAWFILQNDVTSNEFKNIWEPQRNHWIIKPNLEEEPNFAYFPAKTDSNVPVLIESVTKLDPDFRQFHKFKLNKKNFSPWTPTSRAEKIAPFDRNHEVSSKFQQN